MNFRQKYHRLGSNVTFYLVRKLDNTYTHLSKYVAALPSQVQQKAPCCLYSNSKSQLQKYPQKNL
jgi:hypothetical protein